MLRNIILTTLTLLTFSAFGQATVYSGNFEPPFVDWTLTGDVSPNFWLKDICAGNGASQPGTHALYISEGGVGPGCGVGSLTQYSYTNSASGIKQAIAYTTIDGTCASALQATFDYKIVGVASEDFGELIYSTNGGASWTPISVFASSVGWTTNTVSLPLSLNFSTFLLGVRFTYNNTTLNGVPLAIDNFVVTGTDTQNPVVTCPTSITQQVNASCVAIADDYTKSIVTLSDNCTDSAFILVTQNIPEFSIVPVLPGNSTIITLTAEDETGNTSQCTFILNIIDDIAPMITQCPSDTSIYVNATCQGTIGNYAPLTLATDNCSGTLTYSQSPVFGTTITGSNINTIVQITVADPFGNSTQCTLNALTVDTILPTVTCPGTQILYANVACNATLANYTSLVSGADNCVPSSSLSFSQSPAPSTVISADQVVTITMTGGIPATPVTCQFTVDFIDTIKPNVLCPVPSTIYLNSSCEAAIPDYSSSISWTDNCTSSASLMTFSQTPVGGTLTATNQTIVITATDPSGNFRSCSINQIVVDTIKPILTCPSNQTLNMNSSCFATLPNYVPLVTDVENCFFVNDVVYTQTPVASSSINGVVTVTINGTDESGNTGTCSFTVTPIDLIQPTITCPVNSTVNTNSGCTYILPSVTAGASVNDNCTAVGSLIVSQSPAAGTALAVGSHTITLTVTDQANNTANCAYELTVVDQTAPSITCPASQNVNVDVNCSGTLSNYTGLVTMSDNCTATPLLTISQSPANGTIISANTQITMTVTDQSSNTATCTFFAVTIDNTDPVVTCPGTMDMTINSSCQYIIPDLSSGVTGSDNCSSISNMTITQNPVVGATGTGMTAVLITLTDEQGNNATCITMLSPIDTETPIITCPSPAPVNNGANCDYTLGFFSSTALVLDNCSGYTITQTPAAGTVVQTGTNLIQLEVMDAGGNTAQCSFNLVVNENVAPTITCPSNISTCNPVVNFTDPTFNDNCFAFVTQTDATGLVSGDVFPIGITTLTYTVEDSSSNTQTCSFQIEVLDFPSAATITEDSLFLCQTTSALLEADPATSGIGEWTLVSGQGAFNNQMANITGVNNLLYGTNVFAWTITSATCGTTSDTIVITVSQTPLPASTLDTVIACNSTSFQLSANVPLYGIGTWTTDLGASINDVNLATATASNFGPGWNQFVWTVTNGACPASSDTMHLFSTPIANIDLQDTAVCLENGTFVLNGTIPVEGQSVAWMFISGSGQLSDVQSPTSNLDNLGMGTNILTYRMSHPLCPTTYDTVTIVSTLCEDFNPVFPTVITPNFDGKNDLFVIDYLEKVYPECQVTIFNRWGSVVFESVGYQEPWDGSFNGEPLPMGTYFYKVELNDDKSTVYNGPISIIH
jgi:gliding motility-associated-like protein